MMMMMMMMMMMQKSSIWHNSIAGIQNWDHQSHEIGEASAFFHHRQQQQHLLNQTNSSALQFKIINASRSLRTKMCAHTIEANRTLLAFT